MSVSGTVGDGVDEGISPGHKPLNDIISPSLLYANHKLRTAALQNCFCAFEHLHFGANHINPDKILGDIRHLGDLIQRAAGNAGAMHTDGAAP